MNGTSLALCLTPHVRTPYSNSHQICSITTPILSKSICSSSCPLQQPRVRVSIPDYCSSFLTDFPAFGLPSSRLVLYAAARMIFQKHNYDHATLLFKTLQWLSTALRIKVPFNLHGAQTLCDKDLLTFPASWLTTITPDIFHSSPFTPESFTSGVFDVRCPLSESLYLSTHPPHPLIWKSLLLCGRKNAMCSPNHFLPEAQETTWPISVALRWGHVASPGRWSVNESHVCYFQAQIVKHLMWLSLTHIILSPPHPCPVRQLDEARVVFKLVWSQRGSCLGSWVTFGGEYQDICLSSTKNKYLLC